MIQDRKNNDDLRQNLLKVSRKIQDHRVLNTLHHKRDLPLVHLMDEDLADPMIDHHAMATLPENHSEDKLKAKKLKG